MAKKERNPFKELDQSLKDVPPHMKKKVMNDVAMAKLILDIVSLFSSNYKSALAGLFKTNPKIK